jgi:hypothetical protein
MEGSVLIAKREVKVHPLRVPASEFPKFAEFMRTINSETRKQLVLKKP